MPQLEAEGSETVADLKKKIEEGHGHLVSTQKLIYSGQDLSIVEQNHGRLTSVQVRC